MKKRGKIYYEYMEVKTVRIKKKKEKEGGNTGENN